MFTVHSLRKDKGPPVGPQLSNTGQKSGIWIVPLILGFSTGSIQPVLIGDVLVNAENLAKSQDAAAGQGAKAQGPSKPAPKTKCVALLAPDPKRCNTVLAVSNAINQTSTR